ncbi:hypothetical protein F3I01_00185 [Bacillus sp. SRB1LM]|nr:hypothetical protein [Bacillus sp. SRB1LM]
MHKPNRIMCSNEGMYSFLTKIKRNSLLIRVGYFVYVLCHKSFLIFSGMSFSEICATESV